MIRFASVAVAALLAGACHFSADAEERDPGPEVTRSYQVGAFDKIAVAGPYEVKVVTGGQPGVSAKGGENLLAETDVVVEGDTLKIMPKKRKGFRWGWSDGKAVFTVNATALRGAAIAGSGGIAVDKVAGDFDGDVAGSGALNLASPDRATSARRARPTASTCPSRARATSMPAASLPRPPMCRSPGRATSPPTPAARPMFRSWVRATSS